MADSVSGSPLPSARQRVDRWSPRRLPPFVSRLLLVGLAIVALGGGIRWYRTVWRVPRLEIVETNLDLGNGKPNDVMRGTFRLKNTGRAPLEFTTQVFCGCQEVSPRKGTIPPGGELALSVSLKLPGYSNAEKAERVVVHSTDPRRPQSTCVVAARAPAPFQVVPAFIDFGHVAADDVSQLVAELEVRVSGSQHRRLVARFASAGFLARCDDTRVIRVRPAQAVTAGDHYDTLDISLEGSAEELVRVPVHLQVAAALSLVPSTVILRKDPTGSFRPVEWIATTTAERSPLGEMIAVNAPPELQIEEIGRIDDRRRRYRMSVSDAWRAPARFSLTLQESSSAQHCELTILLSDR